MRGRDTRRSRVKEGTSWKTEKRERETEDGSIGGRQREESGYRPGIMQTTQQLDRGLPPVI